MLVKGTTGLSVEKGDCYVSDQQQHLGDTYLTTLKTRYK